MVSASGHQLLRRVPRPAASCLEMGSTSPGALLYDARRLFDAQDARATGEPSPLCGAIPLGVLRAGRLGGWETAGEH